MIIYPRARATPCTWSPAVAVTTPRLFSARHRYSPRSSSLTDTMCRPPPTRLTRDVTRTCRPFSVHVISG
ncbi:hypothetical protein DPMN_039546 [Dreissena polymorpha]|uniref:Uncharacterized protein n=1 Tax=Dreissena polymorpha TaxID=45954 RepID=A0A9D4CVF8_DREPO|nr:hypothetical protein DPMN_039540 [Dreissena polymorpha]KAH3733121.1 hypothetical protein DPMN_039546 [Dreissena polymorpha]